MRHIRLFECSTFQGSKGLLQWGHRLQDLSPATERAKGHSDRDFRHQLVVPSFHEASEEPLVLGGGGDRAAPQLLRFGS